MKISESSIPDITESNIDQQKVLLLDRILSLMKPLLDITISKRVEEKKNFLSIYEKNQKEITERKDKIEKLSKEYEREKKIKQAFDSVENIDRVKLDYNRTLKNEIVVLLRIIEKMPTEKISSYLQNILRVSNKTATKPIN